MLSANFSPDVQYQRRDGQFFEERSRRGDDWAEHVPINTMLMGKSFDGILNPSQLGIIHMILSLRPPVLVV